MLSGLLMVAALFLLVERRYRAVAGRAAVALAVVAASAEGLYAIVDLLAPRARRSRLLDMNIDAVTDWPFGGLRIDNVPRSLWYTPQHTTAIALGLVGCSSRGRRRGRAAGRNRRRRARARAWRRR